MKLVGKAFKVLACLLQGHTNMAVVKTDELHTCYGISFPF